MKPFVRFADRLRIDLIIFVAVISIGGLWSMVSSMLTPRPVPASSRPTPAASRPRQTPTRIAPEVTLAALDDRASQAGQYSRLLDAVDAKCTESRDMIADMTVRSVQIAREEGRRTDNLDMLNGLRNATASSALQECAPVFAAIVVTME